MGEDVKPNVTGKIIVTVRAVDGTTHKFMMKRTSKFEKVFTEFEKRIGATSGTMRFLYHERRLRPQETPEEIEFEDEDEITAEMSQVGGGPPRSPTSR